MGKQECRFSLLSVCILGMHLTFLSSLKFSLKFHFLGKFIMSLIRNFLGHSGKTNLCLFLKQTLSTLKPILTEQTWD